MNWDEDRVAYLKEYGWDLSNDSGQPLLITRHVCRVIEAVAKGIAGKAMETEVIETENWGEKIKRDAEKFAQQKRVENSKRRE
jgi:hypothetical protein